MSEKCQAIVGYLLPRKSCTLAPTTTCSKCRVAICHRHAEITPSGTVCSSCLLPNNMKPKATELEFTEEDLLAFAEAYRQEKNASGGWIEFT